MAAVRKNKRSDNACSRSTQKGQHLTLDRSDRYQADFQNLHPSQEVGDYAAAEAVATVQLVQRSSESNRNRSSAASVVDSVGRIAAGNGCIVGRAKGSSRRRDRSGRALNSLVGHRTLALYSRSQPRTTKFY